MVYRGSGTSVRPPKRTPSGHPQARPGPVETLVLSIFDMLEQARCRYCREAKGSGRCSYCGAP